MGRGMARSGTESCEVHCSKLRLVFPTLWTNITHCFDCDLDAEFGRYLEARRLAFDIVAVAHAHETMFVLPTTAEHLRRTYADVSPIIRLRVSTSRILRTVNPARTQLQLFNELLGISPISIVRRRRSQWNNNL